MDAKIGGVYMIRIANFADARAIAAIYAHYVHKTAITFVAEAPTTADFVSGIMKSVPPMQEIFDMAGMKLPEYMGTKTESIPTDTHAE